MIPKNEIIELATQASLQTHVIEKDYVLGWLLAGIHQHPALRDNWVFKGGTCLKKCYFDTYRFSEDLDFTLRDPSHINADFLLATFAEIAEWIYEQSGIEIPPDRMKFEVFAEKIRALKERTRPRDLYDVINFYRRPESREVADDVKSVLAKKCEFKSITFPTLADLDDHKEVCATGWDEQLRHQLQALPPFDSYWNELASFFSWLDNPESALFAQLPAIPAESEGEANTITLAAGSPNFSTLEHVRFAAVNRLCVELDYRKENGQRSTYVIEPYSLRTTREGNMLLYGVKLPTGEIRCFRTDRIIGATVSQKSFAPRYSIDFIPEGPVRLSARQMTSTSLALPQRRSSAPRARTGRTRAARASGGPKYVFRCSVCGKQFTRTTYDSHLNPHKNKQGYYCYGTTGLYVKTRY